MHAARAVPLHEVGWHTSKRSAAVMECAAGALAGTAPSVLCLHRRQQGTPVGTALTVAASLHGQEVHSTTETSCRTVPRNRCQQGSDLPACWWLHRGQITATGVRLHGPAVCT